MNFYIINKLLKLVEFFYIEAKKKVASIFLFLREGIYLVTVRDKKRIILSP